MLEGTHENVHEREQVSLGERISTAPAAPASNQQAEATQVKVKMKEHMERSQENGGGGPSGGVGVRLPLILGHSTNDRHIRPLETCRDM